MRAENGAFLGFASPKYTQVPDELFDELLADLSGSELKVLLYVCRRTFGFKRDSDHISLSQLVSGITRKDGTVLDRGTGLGKDTVVIATRSLVDKGILTRKRASSADRGFESSEYALVLTYSHPLSENPTSPLVGKSLQGLVGKSDSQETVPQETHSTFRNAVNRPVYRAPVDKSRRDKEEYLAGLILQVCRDRQSIGYYRQVAHFLPERAVYETLSQVQEAEKLGRIRERPGAMFTDLIKRKAAELGLEFGRENRDLRPELGEYETRQSPIERAAEISFESNSLRR